MMSKPAQASITPQHLEMIIQAISVEQKDTKSWLITEGITLTFHLRHAVDVDLLVHVHPGFTFEHSVPTVFGWFRKPTFGLRAAAFVHDVLYRYSFVDKAIADRIYHDLTTAMSSSWKTNLASKTVSVFGIPQMAFTLRSYAVTDSCELSDPNYPTISFHLET